MSDALLPCPFCGVEDGDHDGGLPFLRLNSAGLHGAEYVHCYHCGGSGARQETEAQAIAAWNERDALRSGDGWTRVVDGKPPSNIPVEVRVPCPFGFKFWAVEKATHWRPLPSAPEDR